MVMKIPLERLVETLKPLYKLPLSLLEEGKPTGTEAQFLESWRASVSTSWYTIEAALNAHQSERQLVQIHIQEYGASKSPIELEKDCCVLLTIVPPTIIVQTEPFKRTLG